MTKTTRGRGELEFIANGIAAMMLVVDVTMIVGLGFDYVLSVLLAFPQLDLLETLSALGTIAFLLLVQILFLPLIAFLLEFPSEQL
jgi:hypothetical protein